ncbi:MAG: nuclear transport factor 2 family protein [Pyrinomonadaceae bacterium]|nr:nuclear transport factor 2 family protein [Pyrinomonadaceae bacterium]
MNTICKILTVSLITVFAVVSVSAKCTDSQKAALKKMDKDWGNANQTRNRAALDGMLSSHYSAFSLSGSTDKKAAMAIMDQPAPEPDNNVLISDHYIIKCSVNTAVMTHRNEFHDIEGGKGEVFYSRSVHVFENAGGKWSVVASVNHPMDDEGNLIYMTYGGLEAFKKKDLEWFKARTHDQAVSVDQNGKISGKSEMIKGVKDAPKFEKIKIEDIGANVNGDMGTVVVTYMVEGKAPDGTDMGGRYRISRNYVRENGKWLMMSAHATKMEVKQ